MIRQRVDIQGRIRLMESRDDIAALKIPSGQIGIIKEDPTLRWLDGQEKWDKKFHNEALKVVKERRKIEVKTRKFLDRAREQGLLLVSDHAEPAPSSPTGVNPKVDGHVQDDRRWGPLDLDDENPPPSAIVKRRDTVSCYGFLCECRSHVPSAIVGGSGSSQEAHISYSAGYAIDGPQTQAIGCD